MAKEKTTKKGAKEAAPQPTDIDVEQALERLDKLAESQLEMARLFVDKGKPEIARRRLGELLELYPKSASAGEARKLLKRL